MRYDWRGAITNQYHWVAIYKGIREWKPELPWFKVLWLTIKFPHIHEE